MKIKSIEFKNIASYGNKIQKIEFDQDTAELYLTLGKNGDGKTTIANAIIFALYGKVEGVRMSDLPNRINKDMLVRIKLKCGTMDVEIERGLAPNKFSVMINGVDIGIIGAATGAVDRGTQVAAAINAKSSQTGVTATSNTTTGAVSLKAADGRNITISTTTAGAAETGLTTSANAMRTPANSRVRYSVSACVRAAIARSSSDC